MPELFNNSKTSRPRWLRGWAQRFILEFGNNNWQSNANSMCSFYLLVLEMLNVMNEKQLLYHQYMHLYLLINILSCQFIRYTQPKLMNKSHLHEGLTVCWKCFKEGLIQCFWSFLETVVCGAVELDCIILRSVSNILSTMFISITLVSIMH